MKKVYLILLIFLLTGCGASRVDTFQTERENTAAMEEASSSLIDNETMTDEKQIQTLNQQDEKIEAYLQTMSIEEKIGQLFMIAFRKNENGQPITMVDKTICKILKDYHIGGVILFAENIETKDQTSKFIQDLQAASGLPLWIGVDEEGGDVSRVGKNKLINEVPFKKAYTIGQTNDTQVAYNEASRMGKLLKEIGFNLDFAPVADIYNEASNTVIGHRSFGISQEEVTPMVLAFAKGLIDKGIQPVIKHFPGHGNTVEDSHEGIAYVNKNLKALEEEELIPFKVAIENGVGAIMKGHLMVPAVDDRTIVSLSSKWKTYMESHYDLSSTLVMTDAMDMGAVVQDYESSEAAVLSILAGNDILLMPYDLEKAYEGILKAYKEGRITEERIDESVRKILSKKVAQNILVLS